MEGEGKGRSVTELLRAWGGGDPEALAELVPLVYDELRRQAARQMRRERRAHTLRPTALVHEAYLRLAREEAAHFQNRAHFFGVAGQAMRRILVDHARRRGAGKRAGKRLQVTLDEGLLAESPRDLDALALARALEELAAVDPAHARLVELRFFAGLDLDETAAALGVSVSTVTRDWRLVRAWLHTRLTGTST